MIRIITIICCLLFGFISQPAAQNPRPVCRDIVATPPTALPRTHHRPLWQRMRLHFFTFDSTLAAKQTHLSYDTLYIGRPRTRLTLKLRTNLSGSTFRISGKKEEVEGKGRVSTDNKATLSIGATYRGISAGFALNPAKLSGRNRDYELNINAYANRYGVDVVYQSSKTLSGTLRANNEDYYLQKGVLEMNILTVNGHYVFNHRRFSYPAAFSQSYIQHRSAGSWLVGLSYMGGSIKTSTNGTTDIPKYRAFVGHFSIGGGYAYNFVTKHHWLLHLSMLPTLALANLDNIQVDGERRDMHTEFPDIILAERASVVKNFSQKYFAGATLVMNNSLFGNKDIDIDYSKWRTRIFFGYRL